MSSSEPAVRRRRELLRLLAGAPLLLAGCNMRPVYGPSLEGKVEPALAAIAIDEAGSRREFSLRDYLLDELNPGGRQIASLYTLQLDVDRQLNALAIQLDDQITRYNLILAARFQLVRDADKRQLYRSAVRRVSSYNVRRDPFSTLVAQQDAERRAAREVARAIRTALSLYFASPAAA